jgi:hypothetical protein
MESRPTMSWTDPPLKPTLCMNGSKDARWAKGLLEKYAIPDSGHGQGGLVRLAAPGGAFGAPAWKPPRGP